MKVFKTLRNHWKKSVFLFGLSVFGGRYGYNRYYERLLLRQYCQKIQSHSTETISVPHKSIKSITVFFNPSASNGKAEKTFKKFVVPMLNMTGINFIVVPTAYEGHVSSLLKYLPTQTEAIVVAGGDGMLQDTITGILRYGKLAHLPVGYIPLGTNNTFASRFLDRTNNKSRIDRICQSVINITDGHIENLPILEIQPEKGRNLYAVSYFTWGAIKESLDLIPKYWWLGKLQTFVAMFRYAIKSDWPRNVSSTVDGVPSEFANLTVLPGTDGLTTHYWTPVNDRLEFLTDMGLLFNKNKDCSLLEKLTLPEGGYFAGSGKELSIIPHVSGTYCIDGESVDTRTITIKYRSDGLNMFVPLQDAPVETPNVIPDLPKAFARLFTDFRNFLNI